MDNFNESVLVTGAAGSLGRALCETFIAAGYRVIGLDRSYREGIPGATVVEGDVGSEETLRSLPAWFEGADRITLINNAAVRDRHAQATETATETWDEVIATNLTAPFLLIRAILPLMIASGGGSIINIASIAGVRGGRAGTAYTVSKHGLIGLTRNIAVAYGPEGVRCNAICPGSTLRDRASGDDEPTQRGQRLRDGLVRRAPGSADAVLRLALFLAGTGADRLNGAVLPVDDGDSAR